MAPRLFVAAGLALAVMAGLVRPTTALAQDEKPKGPSAAMLAVQEDLQQGKLDAAITKLDAILKDKPKDMQALFILVIATQQKGQSMIQDRKASIPTFMKSAEAAKTLRTIVKNPNPQQSALIGTALYNGACTLAIDGKPEKAVAMLKEAFDAGFNELPTFEKDEELDSLRKRDDFKAIEKSVKEKKDAAEKKQAEEAKVDVPKLFKEHKAFAFNFNLPDVDGKKLALDDLKGKVVIVDFWGTWCPPCRKEIPHFVGLYKDYKDKGLEIVGLNYNEEGTPDEVKKTIKAFLAENKVPYRCIVGDDKTQDQVPDLQGYPTTLFLDRTGKVRLKIEGAHDKEVLEEIVKTLLDEKAK
jgi:thiol-disulfide isomerase/thioredoxin